MRLFFSVILLFAAVFLRAQTLEVLSVSDGAYPEITVRLRLATPVKDSLTIIEQGKTTAFAIKDLKRDTTEKDYRMFVFLAENSYFFYRHGLFPEIKKALCSLGENMPENANANVLFFGFRNRTVKYVSAAQSKDFPLLNANIEDCFLPQKDSSFIENRLYQAIEEAVSYAEKHKGRNGTVILTVISRGLNLSNTDRFPEGLEKRLEDGGVYFNCLMYDTQSYNAKHELKDLAAATGGDFCLFNASNLEAGLAQTVEKMGKIKPKSLPKEYALTFQAAQEGVSNSFLISYAGGETLCVYTNPHKTGFFGKYPIMIGVICSVVLTITAVIMYYKTRRKILRRMDSSVQTRVSEIVAENKKLRRELEKYRRHPDSVLKSFEKFTAEENLIGSGKMIPKLLVRDGEQNRVFELGKMIMTIGRGENCDIVVSNRTVSANHAALSFEGGMFYITDNNSTNGTFINDIRITKGKVSSEDIIRIGAVFAKINY